MAVLHLRNPAIRNWFGPIRNPPLSKWLRRLYKTTRVTPPNRNGIAPLEKSLEATELEQYTPRKNRRNGPQQRMQLLKELLKEHATMLELELEELE